MGNLLILQLISYIAIHFHSFSVIVISFTIVKTTKWLIYTVLIGAAPFFIRLFIFLFVTKLKSDYVINEVDMVTFGLVLCISNINELEDRFDLEPRYKTIYVGMSVFLILLFSTFLGLAYFADLDKDNMIDKARIKVCSATLSVLTFIFSFSIYYEPKAKLGK